MSAFDKIAGALPLLIREVAVSDPTVTLVGDGWSLTLACPWTMAGPDRLNFAWDSEDVEDRVWDLIGRKIEALSAGPDAIDPTFRLSGDVTLSIRADSDLDPWTLMLPGLVVTGMMRR